MLFTLHVYFHDRNDFRKLVLQLANKSEGTIEAMEKRLTKRNTGPREKTEFELMKESKY